VDLRDGATRGELGIDESELVGAWDAPQTLARRITALGALGAVVPSAARPGHWNLVVFPAGFDHVRVLRGRTMRPLPPTD
jgi:hypothetical protein